MKLKFLVFLLGLCFIIAGTTNSFAIDVWTGTVNQTSGWLDVEKSPYNNSDDELCWAASASNMLYYTGWDAGFSDADDIFNSGFVGTWTDTAGNQGYGLNWWFDGTQAPEGSQASQYAGNGFDGYYPTYTFGNYYTDWRYYSSGGGSTVFDGTGASTAIMSNINNDFGVGIGIFRDPDWDGPDAGHALTVWGYDIVNNELMGIWVTDSDDNKYVSDYSPGPPDDTLDYLPLSYTSFTNNGYWFIDQSYAGNSDWWIGYVGGLDMYSSGGTGPGGPPIPEPATMLLLGSGLVGLAGFGRKRFKKN